MWKNVVKPDRPQMTIQHMRFACWITKATDRQTDRQTHTEYVILISFARQQWTCERASILREMYIACLSCYDLERRKAIQRR